MDSGRQRRSKPKDDLAHMTARTRASTPAQPAEAMYSQLGPELRQRSLRKYRAILDAATRMFIEQGYAPTSIDAIADKAQVSKRTVYGHFANKDALFAAVIHSLCAKILPPALDPAELDKASPEEVLQRLGTQFLKSIYTPLQVELFRTITTDSRNFPELGAIMFDGPVTRSEQTVADYLRRQVHAGKMMLASPELAAAQFLGMLKANMHMKLLFKPKTRVTEKEINDYAKAAVRLFLNGAKK